jgi:hypothetical protein
VRGQVADREDTFCALLQSVERLRARAWRGYLDATRHAGREYHEVEPVAWRRLQERLALIDRELWNTLSG